MERQEGYTGIDYFRLVASILIVAIHTSPLSSMNEMCDFILTRIVARVAVPFFFMTSGFFLISRYGNDTKKLWDFVRKNTRIYGIAILVYLPVNVYNGYFRQDNLVPNLLKDIVFDGTLYHLWYLPASIMGGVIAWYLMKTRRIGKIISVVFLLYVLGLLGDSYYGIAERIPGAHGVYQLIFQVCDYTRNGVFFAPVFFLFGGFFADSKYQISLKKAAIGFGSSFLFMFVEAMLLHQTGWQRHDSMYVFLLPCMYYFFHMLLHFRGRRVPWCRSVSLVVYLIHPMVILGVRIIAKLTGCQKLFFQNSLVHFILICVLSLITAMAVALIYEKFCYLWSKKDMHDGVHDLKTERAYIEINRIHLEHNVKVLKRAMSPGCQLMAVLKREAYGHGACEVAVCLNRQGVRAFAVATIDEGIALREYGIFGEILILGYTDVNRVRELERFDLTQTLIGYEYAICLSRQGTAVKAHMKIDTGMHRLGIPCEESGQILQVFALKNITICGIFTHLSCSDSRAVEDIAFTENQIECFYRVLDVLKENGIKVPKCHIQSTYGFLNIPELSCGYVRAGLALYGVTEMPYKKTARQLVLRPVLSLKSRVVLIRNVRKGEYVGYGREFQAERDSRIAILPIGYGDGVPRYMSSGVGSVRIREYIVPIAGRICMDQLAVDITDAPEVVVGDTAVLIEADADSELSASAVAAVCGSISNELLSRLGARLPVVLR